MFKSGSIFVYTCYNSVYFLSLEETKDEPYAWEAREYLRTKLVGEDVWFTFEKAANTTREYGCIYVGKGNWKDLLVLHNLYVFWNISCA